MLMMVKLQQTDEEKLLQEPIVGRLKELLLKFIDKSKIQNWYLTNLNGKTTGQLQYELDAIQPKVILAFGIRAFDTITDNKKPLNKIKGKHFLTKNKKVILIPWYSLEYIFSHSKAYYETEEFFKKLKATYDV